jgi:peptidoglycan/xylan/chitin deacetylase (PgdA/CDA1 family)
MTQSQLPGALVISLDFELIWGVRDRPGAAIEYGSNLLGARKAVPRLLELFDEFSVAATWATVGFLFAESREELGRLKPASLPGYEDPRLGPYGEAVGESEEDDPLHFAPSLIRLIQATPDQEIATHTYSHYYCGEAGQDRRAFREDLRSAVRAAEKFGVVIRSIVFPRNQHNPSYDEVLTEFGVHAYRGNPTSSLWSFSDARSSRSPLKRAGRLIDTYIGTDPGTVPWSEVPKPNGLSDVRASCFLPPIRSSMRSLEPIRLRRMRRRVESAARSGTIVHIWWHPHNFGVNQDENFGFLRSVLEEYSRCREEYGMQSLTMAGVDRMLRSNAG